MPSIRNQDEVFAFAIDKVTGTASATCEEGIVAVVEPAVLAAQRVLPGEKPVASPLRMIIRRKGCIGSGYVETVGEETG